MTTINVSKPSGVVLNPASYTNPVVIDAGITISNSSGDAVSISGAAYVFTIQNQGTISAPGSTAGTGVLLAPGGSITNADSGLITAYAAAISISGGVGTVVNDGSIASTGVNVSGAAYGHVGVDLASGGTVTNAASGSITGVQFGVGIRGGAGDVVNYGSIADALGEAVYLGAGGSVTNAASASIAGADGVEIGRVSGAGTVVNDGSIAGIAFFGIILDAGGLVTNAASASITGRNDGVVIDHATGTVANSGGIAGTSTSGVGVSMTAGGLVTNATSGLIKGIAAGISISGVVGTVVNYGSITGAPAIALASGGTVTNAASATIAGYAGVEIYGGTAGVAGTVVNSGSIAGTSTGIEGWGVVLDTGGSVTNAASASITGGHIGVVITELAAALAGKAVIAGTVVNDGSIAGTGTNGYGVYLVPGGSVTNAASASIMGISFGVFISSATATVVSAGTVVNSGSIAGTGTNGIGVYLSPGGSVTNAATASITGVADGVDITKAAGTVVNDGSIAATGSTGIGVYLRVAGSVTNAAAASITSGAVGVKLLAGGTVVNSGTIIGGRGTSILFDGTGSSRLVLDPGYGLSGVAIGGGSGGSTLELASAASAGTVSNLGTEFANFGSIVFDAGSNWSITGNSSSIAGTATVLGTVQEQAGSFVNAGSIIVDAGTLSVDSGTFDNAGSVTVENSGTFFIANAAVLSGTGSVFMKTGSTTQIATAVQTGAGFYFTDPATLILDDPTTFNGTIGGLGVGDVIALTGQTINSGSITGTTLTLNLAGGGIRTLDVAPGESGEKFTTTPSGGLEVACFRAGTHLLTARGELPVEALAAGHVVVTRSGRLRPIRWIGHRHVDCARHPKPADVWPVRVRTGAFGAGVPHRDLWLSPDHAVFIDGEGAAPGVLIPIRYLINGRTIVQEQADKVIYVHVELPAHEVILAEGLPCESYLDTGNSGAFANGGEALTLHPDFPLQAWEMQACSIDQEAIARADA